MNASELQVVITREVAAEIECGAATGGRIACSLPLAYSDGDSVVVWVEEQGDRFEVSDLGEGYTNLFNHYSPDLKAFSPLAQGICQSLGLTFVDGRIAGATSIENLPMTVWAVGQASARVAEAATFHKPQKSRVQAVAPTAVFTTEVENVLRGRQVEITRNVPLIGASGHRHHVKIFAPAREALVEPIEPRAGFKGVTNTYAMFGDMANVNGFSRYAVLDDREVTPDWEIARLLVQVAHVVPWSERDPWLAELVG